MNRVFGASFDNNRAQLLLACTNVGNYSMMSRLSFLSFLPYVTNDPVPIIKSIENIILFDNTTLTSVLDDEITDIAWDPNTKRTYVGIVDRQRSFYTTSYDMRSMTSAVGGGVTGSRASQCFSQATYITDAGATASPLTFTNDGTVFYSHTRKNGNTNTSSNNTEKSKFRWECISCRNCGYFYLAGFTCSPP